MRHSIVCAALAACLGTLAPGVLPDVGAADGAKAATEVAREATTLYEQGRYAEALPLLERLDREGALTGALLYRLAYCQRSGGDAETGAATERRAVESLEKELATTNEIEVPFYLVNAYQNADRNADALRVAADATARFEQGGLARPGEGSTMFQLGKLYADQSRSEQATRWYTQAVESLTAGGRPGGSYVRRASRYLAEEAFRRDDFDAAQRYFTVLLDAGEATAADLNRLAVARSRVGLYAQAAEAWKQAELANPADANAVRYAGRLATLASERKPLSTVAPSGKAWTQATKEELEAVMKEQSEQVRALRAEAEQLETIDRPMRMAYRERLQAIQAVFVAAALEYVLRGYSIRETAFFGGYAPLILNRSAWRPPKKKSPTTE